MGEMLDVWFTDDAEAFLARAGDVLAAEPVTGTVLATNARRVADHGYPPGLPDRWFALVTAPGGEIRGIAMRTMPFAPWAPYLLAMSEGAAVALADAALARGAEVGGATGLRPATDVFAARVAAARGGEVEVHLHHRLFELRTLVEPPTVPGRLREVRADEEELALRWIHRFFADADEQAGRAAGHLGEASAFGIDDVRRKRADGVLWVWVDAEDRPVHLVGANPPSYGVVRIGPVFTPAAERGRGWAGAAVAEVSRRVLARGERPVLFTDQANPTSNRLYLALGYEPVADTVLLAITS